MEAAEILREIKKLPLTKRIWVVEETLKSIRKNEIKERMTVAVDNLLEDYNHDKNLVAFF